MKEVEEKPAYKLRKKDLIPFVNIHRYFNRCYYAGQAPQPEEDLVQFTKTYSRGMLLGFYDAAVLLVTVFGTISGLEKILGN